MKQTNLIVLAGLVTGAYLLLRNNPAVARPQFVGTAGRVATVETPGGVFDADLFGSPVFSSFDAFLQYEADEFRKNVGLAPGTITPLDMSVGDAWMKSANSGLFT